MGEYNDLRWICPICKDEFYHAEVAMVVIDALTHLAEHIQEGWADD